MKYTQFSPLLNYKEPHGEKTYIVTALECSVYLGCADIHPIFGFAYRMLDKVKGPVWDFTPLYRFRNIFPIIISLSLRFYACIIGEAISLLIRIAEFRHYNYPTYDSSTLRSLKWPLPTPYFHSHSSVLH